MAAKMSILGPTLCYPKCMRSAQGQFPFWIFSEDIFLKVYIHISICGFDLNPFEQPIMDFKFLVFYTFSRLTPHHNFQYLTKNVSGNEFDLPKSPKTKFPHNPRFHFNFSETITVKEHQRFKACFFVPRGLVIFLFREVGWFFFCP